MATPPEPPAAEVEELTEAATETAEEIKDTAAEAEAARKAGDTQRAERLEAELKELRKELSEVRATLKELAERPFHPAPAPKDTAPDDVTPQGKASEAPQDKETTEPPRRKASSAWFGSRA